MTRKMQNLLFYILVLVLFFASICSPCRELLAKEVSAVECPSLLQNTASRDTLPETIVHERAIYSPLVVIPSSVQNPYRSLTVLFFRLLLRILLSIGASGIGFLVSIICFCILWIPSTTSHYYTISYIKSLPVGGR